MELLISTNDGTVICMGSGEEIGGSVMTDEQLSKTQALSLPSELASPNDFLFAEKKVCLY